MSFRPADANTARERGWKNEKSMKKDEYRDEAGHLNCSKLGGLPDIDNNAFPQAHISNRGGEWKIV